MNPLLHPPLQLIRKTPVCPTCGLPVRWYDMGDGIYVNLCVDFNCPGRVRERELIEEEEANTRAFYWCLAMMPLMLAIVPALLVLMVIASFFERLESAMEAFKEAGND